MKQKSPNLTKFNSLNEKIIYEEKSEKSSYVDRQSLISKNGSNGVNRDTNIDIW
jgi:hypothetical protein